MCTQFNSTPPGDYLAAPGGASSFRAADRNLWEWFRGTLGSMYSLAILVILSLTNCPVAAWGQAASGAWLVQTQVETGNWLQAGNLAVQEPTSSLLPPGNETAAEQPVQELDLSPLGPQEQLVLIISNSTDRHGNPSRVLVFLYRTKVGGWEALGAHDMSALRRHWLRVAERRMPWIELSRLEEEAAEAAEEEAGEAAAAERWENESAGQRKVRLSVELAIHQFIRAYEQLRGDLAEGLKSDTPTAMLLQSDEFNQLRGLGVNGIFHRNSLPAKVIAGELGGLKVD